MKGESVRRIGVGVGVLLFNKEGKILLGRRHPDKIKASSYLNGQGTWTMPGGSIDFGGSFEEAAARELREETGIMINPSQFTLISIANNKTATAHFVTAGFKAATSDEPRVCEPETITCWEWFSLNDLPAPLYGPSQDIIERYSLNKIYLPGT